MAVIPPFALAVANCVVRYNIYAAFVGCIASDMLGTYAAFDGCIASDVLVKS
jgi:hypothetical protein